MSHPEAGERPGEFTVMEVPGMSGGLSQKLKVRRENCQGLSKKVKEVTDKHEENSFNEVVGRDVITPSPIYLVGPDEREFD